MSNIALDYSLNDSLFSVNAINCQKSVSSNGEVVNLLENLSKFNCNSIKDPDKFCKCVESISTSGIELSDEEQRDISNEFFTGGTKYVSKAYENKLTNNDLFKNLNAALASDALDMNCINKEFSPFDRIKKKEASGKVLTSNELLKKGIYSKFSERLGKTDQREYEKQISQNFNTIKNEILADARKLDGLYENNDDALKEVISNFDFSKFNNAPPLGLINNMPNKKDQLLNHMILDSKEMTVMVQGTPIAIVQNSSNRSSNSLNAFEVNFLKDATQSACTAFELKVDRLSKVDMNKELRNFKQSVFRPKGDGDQGVLTLVEQELSEILKNSDSNYSKKLLQEKMFNVDKLYCKERKSMKFREVRPNEEKKGYEIMAEIEEVETIRKNEINRKSILEDKLFIANDDIYKMSIKLGKKRSEELYYEGLLSGKFSQGGKFGNKLDYRNKELLELVAGFSESQRDFLVAKGKDQQFHDFPIDKLKAEEILAKLKAENAKSDVLLNAKAAEASSLYISIEELDETINKLVVKQKVLEERAQKVFGKERMDALLSDLDKKTNEVTGTKGTSEMISTYIRPKNSSKVDKLRTFFSKSENQEDFGPKKESLSAQSFLNKEGSKKNQIQTESQSSGGSEIAKSSLKSLSPNIFNRSAVPKGPEIVSRPQVSNKIKSDREIELEKSLKRLEDIVASKNSKSSTSTSPLNTEEEEISELRNQIEIQKLLTEKAKVSKEISDLKKNTSTNLAPVEVVQSEVIKPARASTTNFMASPSSSRPSKDRKASSTRQTSRSTAGANTTSASQVQSSQEQSNSSSQSSTTISNSSSQSADKTSSKSGLSLRSGGDGSSFEVERSGQSQDLGDSRIVKIDFELDSLGANEKEELFKSLFLQGEGEIILETPEGEKIVVKNQDDPIESTIEKEESTAPIKDRRKMSHDELIELLKVGSTNEDQ